ncbi:MAG: sigma-70 family RNA polymerase sigma factor [Actinomycetota bacterium]|nr:sigma-70 family RNA polymerase sigma factor [Actinomycetota bacterium]
MTTFADLYRDEWARAARLAFVIVGDREVASEVAQEAMARAYQHWRRVSRLERPGAWVRRVTIRLAVRSRARARALPALVGVAHSSLDAGDTDLAAALHALSAQQRATIVLHYLEDLSVAEVADVLGCRPGTVKAHLHRARARLAELLGEEAR